MMADYTSFDDRRIKHMEMIQAVIARLGNDAFLVKGWAVTIAGVFFGFAVDAKNGDLAVASLLPTVFFWGLDAYFLRSERLFRALYDRVREGTGDVGPFYMGATSGDFVKLAPKGVSSRWKAIVRPTIVGFYGALLLSAVVLALIVGYI